MHVPQEVPQLPKRESARRTGAAIKKLSAIPAEKTLKSSKDAVAALEAFLRRVGVSPRIGAQEERVWTRRNRREGRVKKEEERTDASKPSSGKGTAGGVGEGGGRASQTFIDSKEETRGEGQWDTLEGPLALKAHSLRQRRAIGVRI